MLKNKKSLAVILSLVMLLAMACGAWAADAVVSADGVAKTATGDLDNTGAGNRGLWALNNGGSIVYTGGTITTNGDWAYGACASDLGKIQGTGNIITSGDRAYGLLSNVSGDIEWVGNVKTVGSEAKAIYAPSNSTVKMTGDVTTEGPNKANALNSATGSLIIYSGNILTSGMLSDAVLANDGQITLNDSSTVTTTGEEAVGLVATSSGSITMTGGTVTVEKDSSYAMYVGAGGVINLHGVSVQNSNLLRTGSAATAATGYINATDSELSGDILHTGTTADTLEINLIDTSLEAAAVASGDIGAIDINLEGSAWIITGDSNLNGTVTGDGGSVINFTLSPEDTEVILDKLKGDADLNFKVGDTLTINNAEGDISSSDPSVIEVVKNPNGSVSIVSKSDGEATLTYQYVDGLGRIQTVTVNVVSGAGGQPYSGGGGGSSNCSAGFGATALLSLLGLALVLRKNS